MGHRFARPCYDLNYASRSFDEYDYFNYNAPTIINPNSYGSGDLDFEIGDYYTSTSRSDLANFTSSFTGSTGYIRFSADYYQNNATGFNITVNANLRTKKY